MMNFRNLGAVERERELYFRELKDSIISYIYKKIAIKA